MPSQHALVAKIYAQQSKTLLNDRDLTREDRAFMRSSAQFGSGLWLNAIPSLQQFRCASAVFKTMLQIRLCLVLGFTENLDRCKCGMQSDTSMRQGRHWMTKCPTHNKMRDSNL